MQNFENQPKGTKALLLNATMALGTVAVQLRREGASGNADSSASGGAGTEPALSANSGSSASGGAGTEPALSANNGISASGGAAFSAGSANEATKRIVNPELINAILVRNLYGTCANMNNDEAVLIEWLSQTLAQKRGLITLLKGAVPEAAAWDVEADTEQDTSGILASIGASADPALSANTDTTAHGSASAKGGNSITDALKDMAQNYELKLADNPDINSLKLLVLNTLKALAGILYEADAMNGVDSTLAANTRATASGGATAEPALSATTDTTASGGVTAEPALSANSGTSASGGATANHGTAQGTNTTASGGATAEPALSANTDSSASGGATASGTTANPEISKIYEFLQTALTQLLIGKLGPNDLIGLALECGQKTISAMEQLDHIRAKALHAPVAIRVDCNVRKRPAILVSGHGYSDLEQLLEQVDAANATADAQAGITASTTASGGTCTNHGTAQGSNSLASGGATHIDVYTHGDMISAHAYPKIKEHKSLIGNYGNSWKNQSEEFASFNGPILMTGGCMMPPTAEYKNRIFTTGLARCEGVATVSTATTACGGAGTEPSLSANTDTTAQDTNTMASGGAASKDFSSIIEMARAMAAPVELERKAVATGFGHAQIKMAIDKIANAIKVGSVKRIVMILGCDGPSEDREYYSQLAAALPQSAVIMTAGCVKYRFNKENLGSIAGVPRLLDMGQCVDAYSAIGTAFELQDALGAKSIGDLPIDWHVSQLEEKSLAIVMALLALGIKGIKVGPTLPKFLTERAAANLAQIFSLVVPQDAFADADAIEPPDEADGGCDCCHDPVVKAEEPAEGAGLETEAKAAAQLLVVKDMLVGDIVEKYPAASDLLIALGMHCLGCPSSKLETLEEACVVHKMDLEQVLKQINELIAE